VWTSRTSPSGNAASAEPLAVTPPTIDAAQPVAAIRADGGVLVAFFTAERGKRAEVRATPLACDPGL